MLLAEVEKANEAKKLREENERLILEKKKLQQSFSNEIEKVTREHERKYEQLRDQFKLSVNLSEVMNHPLPVDQSLDLSLNLNNNNNGNNTTNSGGRFLVDDQGSQSASSSSSSASAVSRANQALNHMTQEQLLAKRMAEERSTLNQGLIRNTKSLVNQLVNEEKANSGSSSTSSSSTSSATLASPVHVDTQERLRRQLQQSKFQVPPSPILSFLLSFATFSHFCVFLFLSLIS
jgi:hypothetical protein